MAAEEPSGCDKFKWNIDRERAALTAPDRVKLASGGELAAPAVDRHDAGPARAAEAKSALAARTRAQGRHLCRVCPFQGRPKAGIYTVSLSAGGWVDLVQDGHFLKPKAFSGATDCDGIRKTMKYEIAASPLCCRSRGAREDTVSVAILPSE